MKYIVPVQNGISRGFGNGHNGIDYLSPMNTTVKASGDGVVAFEGWGQNHSWITSMGGITVLIKHDDGYSGYAHLSSTVVNNGQHVKQGQIIGYTGSTGNSTGPHLHFEFLPLAPNFQNGYSGRVDPSNYLAKGGEEIMDNPQDIRNIFGEIWGVAPDESTVNSLTGKSWHHNMYYALSVWPWTNRKAAADNTAVLAEERRQLLEQRDETIRKQALEIEQLKSSSGIDQETKDQIASTHSIVQWIKDKLNTIFK